MNQPPVISDLKVRSGPPDGRIRVLQVTHDLGVGGLPNVVRTLALSLDRDRFDMSVLCLHDRGPLADELEQAGIPVYLSGRKRRPDSFWAFLPIRRFLTELRP